MSAWVTDLFDGLPMLTACMGDIGVGLDRRQGACCCVFVCWLYPDYVLADCMCADRVCAGCMHDICMMVAHAHADCMIVC